MIGAPAVVAGVTAVIVERVRIRRGLTLAPAAHQQDHAAELDENLRCPTGDRVRCDLGSELLHISLGRLARLFSDDVNMIELKGCVAHLTGFLCYMADVILRLPNFRLT